MMLSDVVTIYSETESLTRLAETILLESFSGQIHHHEATSAHRILTPQMTYVPVSSVQQAIELSNQGGSFIWLGSSVRRPDRRLNPVVAICGVNSVSVCRRAIQIAGNHLISAEQVDSLFVAFLPGCMRSPNRHGVPEHRP
jgi:hypothetical protein